MKVEYLRETGGNYMEITGNGMADGFEMKMLRNNKINGLLPLTVRQVNSEYRYLYRINSHVNMSEYYDRQGMGMNELDILINSLVTTLKELKEYMLDESGLIMNPDYIFKSNSEGVFRFAYFYSGKENFTEKLRHLFENILGIIDHNDNEVVTVAYGIYKRLCMGECSLEELFSYDRKKDCAECEVVTEVKENPMIIPETVYEEEEVPQKMQLYMLYGAAGIIGVVFLVSFIMLMADGIRPSGIPKGLCGIISIVCGIVGYFLYRWYIENKDCLVKIVTKEVSVPYTTEKVKITLPQISEENLTTVLTREEEDEYILQWQENGILKKYIVKSDTIIGSMAEKVDCHISLPGVSRTHAKIIKENDRYYVKDLNSTNGTKVNDVILSSYQLVPINRNDILTVGNVKLMFN